MPRVTVILTSFNHEGFIAEAIESVLNQTFKDFELIIWDDASSDHSWEVISRYSDKRIRKFRNDSQRRGIWALNTSISELATGEYIAVHHSDDVWEPQKLEHQVLFLDENPSVGAVFTNAQAITEAGALLADNTHFYFNIFEQPNRSRHEWLRFFFYQGNALCHPSILVRKTCYEDSGLYRFGLGQICDLEMWVRLCLKHEIHVLPDKLIRFRVHSNDGNTSAVRPDTKIRGFFEFFLVLRNYLLIDSFDELVKIFPNAQQYDRGPISDVKFAFAMAALDEPPFPFTALFAQNLLYEIISDANHASRIKEIYNFDYHNFIAITAKHDIFLQQEQARLLSRIDAYDQEAIELRTLLERQLSILDNREQHILTLEQEVETQRKELPHLKDQLFQLQVSYIEKDQLAKKLTHESKHFQEQLHAVLNSRSWKLLAPIRIMKRALRKLKNNSMTLKLREQLSRSIEKEAEPAALSQPLPIKLKKNLIMNEHQSLRTSEKPLAFFTICSKNFLAHARVLYNSVRPHYPNSKFFVVLCDRVDGFFDPEQEPFEFIYLEELNLPNLDEMAKHYNITEFNTAVKPFAFLHLMDRHGFGSVAYLDPDLLFVDKMQELDAMLLEGAEAVLTPHILQPAEHDEVHDGKMLLFGIYNLGFLALRNTPSVRAFLSWWGRRLERDCVIRLDQGLFVDQKWADLLPAFVPGTRVLHHPGYNVAYWNLPQRKITRQGDQWFANAQPLRFVHFSGNKIDDLSVFSRHSQQVTMNNIGDLRQLLDFYREQVFNQGHQFYRKLPYAFSWDGVAGMNLHTPKSLDMATPDNGSQITPAPAGPAISHVNTHNRMLHRLSTLRRAFPLAQRLSGGWQPLMQRAWRSYRHNGWSHVKTKIVELSNFRAPPTIVPANTSPAENCSPKKRILYLDWAIPKPDQDAASVTTVLLMEILESLGYAVTFIPCSLKYEEGYYETLINTGVDVICYPNIHSVKDWISENAKHFDIAILARGPVVRPYLESLKNCAPNLRLIFNTVDLHYLRELRQAELTNNEKARAAALFTQAQEFELIKQCDLTILLSNEELYTVRDIYPDARLAVLPVVFSEIPGAIKKFAERQDILFIGSFPHQPNIDAVIYFSEQIFPLIQQRIPDIRFKIVGANPPESISKLAENPSIDVMGFVKDLAPLFENIRLSIAPLRYGAGIKGKIGSSFCYGVPCIATPVAAEGMGLCFEKNILIGETPAEFADAVCRAYLDKNLWQHLSSEGHKFALENYSVRSIRERVRNLLGAVAIGRPPMEWAAEIDSWESFQRHLTHLKYGYENRLLLEQSLLPADDSTFFHTHGFCCACNRRSEFLTSFQYSTGNTPDGRPMPNWREHMQCEHCGLVNRVRAAIHALHTLALPAENCRIYMTEQLTSTYQWFQAHYPNLQGSEYFGPDFDPGTMVDGIRHEDVMNLSFADSNFDRILSFDVLEHVPDPEKAFREIYRVLDNDGIFLFSVPFSADSRTDIVRAAIKPDGAVEHYLPPEYHGNPVDLVGGALCFRYFGWEMLDRLRAIGFSRVRAIAYWSEEQGYLGKEQFLFIAEKLHEDAHG